MGTELGINNDDFVLSFVDEFDEAILRKHRIRHVDAATAARETEVQFVVPVGRPVGSLGDDLLLAEQISGPFEHDVQGEIVVSHSGSPSVWSGTNR